MAERFTAIAVVIAMSSAQSNHYRYIGLPMARAATLSGVASDITPAQNARLRAKMRAHMNEHCDGNVTTLARLLGRAQPSISNFLNGKGGASIATARRFARVVGDVDVDELLGPENPLPGESLDVAPAVLVAQPEREMRIGTFLLKLARLPGLERWVTNHSSDVSVAEVARGILVFEAAPSLSKQSDGSPMNGWGAFFGDLRTGRIGVLSETTGTPEIAAELESEQHKELPKTTGVSPRKGRRRGK